jgi:integrase/recombinase XerD
LYTVKETSKSFVLLDDNMRIIPEVLDFTRWIERKEYSPNTVLTYLEKLKVFYEWMDIEGLRPFEVKPSHLTYFQEYIDKAYTNSNRNKDNKVRVSASTMNGYIAALQSFYKYAEVNGFVEPSDYKISNKRLLKDFSYLKHVQQSYSGSVWREFKRKIKQKVDKKRLSDDEAKHFYEKIGEVFAYNEGLKRRNQLAFKILYETGMRIGELLHLRIKDYDLPDPFKKVGNIYLIERKEQDDKDRQLKTGERIIPVSNDLLQEIDEYIMYHRPLDENSNCEYIFVNHNYPAGQAPNRSYFEQWFRKVFKTVELESLKRKIVTPHSLRHTHSSNLHEMGMDISVIQARVGHKSLNTTKKYVHVSIETLTNSYCNYLERKQQQGGAF